MTWKEFKKLVNEVPDDMNDCPVIMQKDSEGNGYSPLAGLDANCAYIPKNTYSGDVYDLTWSAEDADMEEEEWEKTKENKCITLYPTN